MEPDWSFSELSQPHHPAAAEESLNPIQQRPVINLEGAIPEPNAPGDDELAAGPVETRNMTTEPQASATVDSQINIQPASIHEDPQLAGRSLDDQTQQSQPAIQQNSEQDPQGGDGDTDQGNDEVEHDNDTDQDEGDGNDPQDGQPPQPVNWAPAGINNMDPNWVHSVDAIAESYDCKICADAPADTERVFLECGHVFCPDCLNQNFRHALINRANFPPKCCRNQSISFDLAQYHLEEDVMVLALQHWEEWSAPDPTYCQTRGCTGGMIFDHFVVDQWALCKICSNRTCTECKALESAHESPDKHPNALSEEDAVLVKQEGWKQCPKCRKVIERIDGCDHMQCSACQTHFCYRCGGSLQNGMGCNCGGQNPWVNDVQADIDGAQNGGQHHNEDDDREEAPQGGDGDGNEHDIPVPPQQPTADDPDGGNNNWVDPHWVPNAAAGWNMPLPPVPQTPPQPAQPETMTVAFNQMHTIADGSWVPAPAPQRNPVTGALEWVLTRIEGQADNTAPQPASNQ